MKAFLRFVSSLLLVTFLAGWSSRFIVKVNQVSGMPPSFEFFGEGSHAGKIRINSFFVVRKGVGGKWDYKHPVWSFKLPPGSGEELSTVTYGQVPNGFTEVVSAAALSSGTTYLATALGMGADGDAQFDAN
jgi:hypothetical protein